MRGLFIATMLLTVSASAYAGEATLICGSEQAAETIAEKMVQSVNVAQQAAQPLVEQGVCAYVPAEVHVHIAYHGKTYGHNAFRVEVVGFMDALDHMMYGLLPQTSI